LQLSQQYQYQISENNKLISVISQNNILVDETIFTDPIVNKKQPTSPAKKVDNDSDSSYSNIDLILNEVQLCRKETVIRE